MTKNMDIYIVGLGGQGVLTIGDLLSSVAMKKGMNVNFYPTKGMSQRGGFVQAQLRIGDDEVGPSLASEGADLIISLERSESLKACKYIKPQADFLLYGSIWQPTGVMLGKDAYPALDVIISEIVANDGVVKYLDPENLPEYQGKKVRDNIFIVGAALANTCLKDLFTYEEVKATIETKWARGAEENLFAFEAGYSVNL